MAGLHQVTCLAILKSMMIVFTIDGAVPSPALAEGTTSSAVSIPMSMGVLPATAFTVTKAGGESMAIISPAEGTTSLLASAAGVTSSIWTMFWCQRVSCQWQQKQ